VLYGKANKAFVVGERELRVALTGPSGLHGIVGCRDRGPEDPHHAVLKDYQQHPVRGTITHVDFHEVRLDQPIHATVAVQLVGEAPGRRSAAWCSRSPASFTSRRCRRIFPSTSRSTSAAWSSAMRCACRTCAAVAGVTFLDDAADTVIASCSSPRGLTEAEEAADEELAAEASAESAAAAAEEDAPAEEE
jgi:large subunit ribosomal protein L25